MSSSKFLLVCFFIALVIVMGIPQTNCRGCEPSSCGNIRNISYPFRLRGDPENCGDHDFELVCENNHAIMPCLGQRKYYVQAINYDNFTIRVVDSVIVAHKKKKNNTCFSLPLYSSTLSECVSSNPGTVTYDIDHPDKRLEIYYLSDTGGYRSYQYKKADGNYFAYFSNQKDGFDIFPIQKVDLTFISCPYLVNSSVYVEITGACVNGSVSRGGNVNDNDYPNLGRHYYYYYAIVGGNSSQVRDNCSIAFTAKTSLMSLKHGIDDHNHKLSLSEIHNALLYGFELSWSSFKCPNCTTGDPCYVGGNIYEFCPRLSDLSDPYGPYESHPLCNIEYGGQLNAYFNHKCGLPERLLAIIMKFASLVIKPPIVIYLAPRIALGVSIAIIFLIIKWRRRHWSIFEDIEDYLQSQNNLTPIRYSYSEIKKMAKGFNDKLGEGGYGSVYKGKFRSGILVAIKILGKTKTNGQEFISEVGTIGMIHHVNVVQLIGYCAERSKRALVYEFMPNGSLDKYLFPREEKVLLDWEKKYKIALGVAQGINYLHRGCDMQILHFDIKPHNILLDENFVPKVSDFGLARLYPTDNSIVSLTVARGTIGYVAPELINRSIGGISYKADIYSFGMLLMEMAAMKKNLTRSEENSSQYFPNWIYEHFKEGYGIEIEDATDDEKKIVRKITLVALWCIQTNPVDRPSMTKVVEMLEGEVELLQLPPEPIQTPPYASIQNQTWTGVSSDSITLLCDPSNSTTLQIE